MSQLAWASLAALIAFCFHAHWGLRGAQRRGLAGLASRDGARLGRSWWWKVLAPLHSPPTPPPVRSCHTALFSAAPIPGVHSGATKPLAIPALQLPAMRSWGGVLETPSKQGGGFSNWPGNGGEGEEEGMRILSNVQPTAASLEAVWPAWVEVEKGKGENRGRRRRRNWRALAPHFFY